MEVPGGISTPVLHWGGMRGPGHGRVCWESFLLRCHFRQKELPVQKPGGKGVQDTFRNSEVQLGCGIKKGSGEVPRECTTLSHCSPRMGAIPFGGVPFNGAGTGKNKKLTNLLALIFCILSKKPYSSYSRPKGQYSLTGVCT